MTTTEIVVWVSLFLLFVFSHLASLRNPEQRVSLRFLFIRYEGSLTGLWPAVVLLVAAVGFLSWMQKL